MELCEDRSRMNTIGDEYGVTEKKIMVGPGFLVENVDIETPNVDRKYECETVIKTDQGL